MKKRFLLAVILSSVVCGMAMLMTFGCSVDGNSVKGHIEGLDNDTLVVISRPLNTVEDARIDVLMADRGKFYFDLPYDYPVSISIIPRSIMYIQPSGKWMFMSGRGVDLLILEPEKLKVKGEIKGDALEYSVSGSEFNKEYARLRMEMLPIDIKQNANTIEYTEAGQTMGRPTREEMKNSIFQRRNVFLEQKMEIRRNYIRNNPDSEMAGAMFLEGVGFDSIGVYHALLSDRVKDGIFSERIRSEYQDFVDYQQHINELEIVPGDTEADWFDFVEKYYPLLFPAEEHEADVNYAVGD